MLIFLFSVGLRLRALRRKIRPVNDNEYASAVFRLFATHLARHIRQGRSKTWKNPPPSVRMV